MGFICGNEKSGTSPQTNNMDKRGCWAKWATHWRPLLVFSAQLWSTTLLWLPLSVCGKSVGQIVCYRHYSVVIWFSLFHSVGLHNVICGSVGWCLLWGRSISRHSFPLLDGWVSEWVGGWVSGWVSEWVGGWVSEWVSEWVGGWVSGWVREWVGG